MQPVQEALTGVGGAGDQTAPKKPCAKRECGPALPSGKHTALSASSFSRRGDRALPGVWGVVTPALPEAQTKGTLPVLRDFREVGSEGASFLSGS